MWAQETAEPVFTDDVNIAEFAAAFKSHKAKDDKSEETFDEKAYQAFMLELTEGKLMDLQDHARKIVSFMGFSINKTKAIVMGMRAKNPEETAMALATVVAYYVANGTSIRGSKLARLASPKAVRLAMHYFRISKAKVNKVNQGPEVLTIQRIVSAFWQYAVIARIGGGPSAGVVAEGTYESANYVINDEVFCSPEGAYFIPQTKPECWAVWNKWNKKHHDTINSGKHTVYSDQVPKVRMTSSPVQEKDRLFIFDLLMKGTKVDWNTLMIASIKDD
jgi:hypothetical protein